MRGATVEDTGGGGAPWSWPSCAVAASGRKKLKTENGRSQFGAVRA
jgi:hypothetical protein